MKNFLRGYGSPIYQVLFALFILLQVLTWMLAWMDFPGVNLHPVFIGLFQVAGIIIVTWLLWNKEKKKENPPEKDGMEKRKDVLSQEKDTLLRAYDESRGNRFVEGLETLGGREDFGRRLMQNMNAEIEIMQAVFYCRDSSDSFSPVNAFALKDLSQINTFREGEALAGQALKNRDVLVISDVPPDYRRVSSGLGSSLPAYLFFIPLLGKEKAVGLLEFSTFREVSAGLMTALKEVPEKGGLILEKLVSDRNE